MDERHVWECSLKSLWLKSSEQQLWSSLCSALSLSSEAPEFLKLLSFVMCDSICQNGFVEVFSYEAQGNLKNDPWPEETWNFWNSGSQFTRNSACFCQQFTIGVSCLRYQIRFDARIPSRCWHNFNEIKCKKLKLIRGKQKWNYSLGHGKWPWPAHLKHQYALSIYCWFKHVARNSG